MHSPSNLAWPKRPEARAEFVARCVKEANLDPVLHIQRAKTLDIYVEDERELEAAREALKWLSVRFHT